VHDEIDGFGQLSYLDGNVYTGTFQKGKVHGFAKFTSPDGEMRDGSWNFGEFKTGHVRIIWKDGRVYDGEFMDGEISGDGIITWHNGTSVKGHFVRGKYPLEASMSKNRGENDFDVKLFGKGLKRSVFLVDVIPEISESL